MSTRATPEETPMSSKSKATPNDIVHPIHKTTEKTARRSVHADTTAVVAVLSLTSSRTGKHSAPPRTAAHTAARGCARTSRSSGSRSFAAKRGRTNTHRGRYNDRDAPRRAPPRPSRRLSCVPSGARLGGRARLLRTQRVRRHPEPEAQAARTRGDPQLEDTYARWLQRTDEQLRAAFNAYDTREAASR
jgi:hypothetical protein